MSIVGGCLIWIFVNKSRGKVKKEETETEGQGIDREGDREITYWTGGES